MLDKWRSNLKAIGHGGLPFWVTEIGWPTSGTNWRPAQTQQQQSDYFAQFISTAKARSDVAAVIAYQLQDWGSVTPTPSTGSALERRRHLEARVRDPQAAHRGESVARAARTASLRSQAMRCTSGR